MSTDPLKFTDTKPYRTRLESSIEATGQKDAVIAASGRLDGIQTIVAAMEYSFIGGSMGVVVGEKITRAIERAIDNRWPVVIVCSSGGARMMEGALSLMQMAKISGALARLAQERLPYIAVLTDPTTGGVTASFAMLGDLNIAEPKALIGFAGPRVIEQTIRQKLPEGFQRAEFLLEKGMVDLVVDRREMKAIIAKALRFMGAAPLEPASTAAGASDRARGDTAAVIGTRCSRVPVPPRTVRDQVRSRKHRDAARAPRPPGAHVPVGSRRRHKRQGLGHGHGRHGARRAGYRSARYTSPHLIDLSERFVVGGRPVDAAAMRGAAGDVREAIEQLRAEGALQAPPTFFEATTALAFELFRRARVEVAVVEVGLGGRLDSTNVIRPIASAITSIDFDHQQYLGSTLGEIAAEKAGIIKPGMPVIVGDVGPERGRSSREWPRSEPSCRARRRGVARRTPGAAGDNVFRCGRLRGTTARSGWRCAEHIRPPTPSSRCGCSKRSTPAAWPSRRPPSSMASSRCRGRAGSSGGCCRAGAS